MAYLQKMVPGASSETAPPWGLCATLGTASREEEGRRGKRDTNPNFSCSAANNSAAFTDVSRLAESFARAFALLSLSPFLFFSPPVSKKRGGERTTPAIASSFLGTSHSFDFSAYSFVTTPHPLPQTLLLSVSNLHFFASIFCAG
uniref:Uncharacterized protein n=1 Tax=Sphaerodactylus townsendi TaxID=933632 RepID=A0ACB8FZP6_9SAUR